jgi:AcrR family transcriptional regulator
MNETLMAGVLTKISKMDPKVRSGRPRKELAGEVEGRILDAAIKVFLEHGFEGASVEEIAETARSGKPTIYARFPNKTTLFAAAVTHHIAAKHARVRRHTPTGATAEERLAGIGTAVLRESLTSESVALIRLAVAEARRFADLGSSICRSARERGAETVALLLNEAALCDGLETLPAFRGDGGKTAARYFLDLILLPLLMRALGGEDLETLRAEIGRHVPQRVAFFLAACRNDGLSR